MRKSIIGMGIGVVAVVAASAAMASAELAQAKNCMACHAVASKKVGPALKDIAARYAGQKDAEAKLVTKVIKGGAGAWGPVPMPPNPLVSDAESKALVNWILLQK